MVVPLPSACLLHDGPGDTAGESRLRERAEGVGRMSQGLQVSRRRVIPFSDVRYRRAGSRIKARRCVTDRKTGGLETISGVTKGKGGDAKNGQ